MFEKVNPAHPDKVADRIAGALVDLAYTREENPKIAVEVLIGHGECYIITEASVMFEYPEVAEIVSRITNKANPRIYLNQNRQDAILGHNQKNEIRCGDNGIFRGCPITEEQELLTKIATDCYRDFGTDGKYILDLEKNKITICQSHATTNQFAFPENIKATVNPLGYWTGGIDVDSGATNRKLGSDMGDAVTGGGLHGKDLSKADVTVNIYAFLCAQECGHAVEFSCSIGDDNINGKPYSEIVEIARRYIKDVGGFEKFAEWGLIR